MVNPSPQPGATIPDPALAAGPRRRGGVTASVYLGRLFCSHTH